MTSPKVEALLNFSLWTGRVYFPRTSNFRSWANPANPIRRKNDVRMLVFMMYFLLDADFKFMEIKRLVYDEGCKGRTIEFTNVRFRAKPELPFMVFINRD